jgi:hypothetical protein
MLLSLLADLLTVLAHGHKSLSNSHFVDIELIEHEQTLALEAVAAPWPWLLLATPQGEKLKLHLTRRENTAGKMKRAYNVLNL